MKQGIYRIKPGNLFVNREASRRKRRASDCDAEARFLFFPIEWDVCENQGFESNVVRKPVIDHLHVRAVAANGGYAGCDRSTTVIGPMAALGRSKSCEGVF